MRELRREEMLNIKAEGISAGAIAAIAAGIAFLVGVLDGYVRPFKCR